jgi:hypothetical protein
MVFLARAEAIASRSVRRLRGDAARLRQRIEERSESREAVPEDVLAWEIREMAEFRGRAHLAGVVFAPNGASVERVQMLDPVGGFLAASVNGAGSERFEFQGEFPLPADVHVDSVRLRALLSDGTRTERSEIVARAFGQDPYHVLTNRFFTECRDRGERVGGRALEIGSRARSGHVRRAMIEPMDYVGLDIVEGENTDLVGDAHSLSTLLERRSFDAVFSISTFEHLAMPWKVAIEINRVLKRGGLVFAASHHVFPLHDAPWDFWRFSDSAWHALFNEATGFRIRETAMGEPAMIVAKFNHAVTTGLEAQPAYIGSAVLAEKISETDLDWPVDPSVLSNAAYPA